MLKNGQFGVQLHSDSRWESNRPGTTLLSAKSGCIRGMWFSYSNKISAPIAPRSQLPSGSVTAIRLGACGEIRDWGDLKIRVSGRRGGPHRGSYIVEL